jgi:sorbitol-specific phosphotransferase system component IIC
MMQNQEFLIPLFALGLWLFALYIDSKFRYFFQEKNWKRHAEKQTGWRRFVTTNSVYLKYAGLFLMWLGISIAVVVSDYRQSALSISFYIVGISGLALYILSRLWPFLPMR